MLELEARDERQWVFKCRRRRRCPEKGNDDYACTIDGVKLNQHPDMLHLLDVGDRLWEVRELIMRSA
jgi:hypothetical protein